MTVIPLHVRLQRARCALKASGAAYGAFFEGSPIDSSDGFGAVDVFSAAAENICKLELQVWEALQHAFEARCPVPPEEQWRIRQVISDIAAARGAMLLYTRHLKQNGKALETKAGTATELDVLPAKDAGAGSKELQEDPLNARALTVSGQNVAVISEDCIEAAEFEALVLTKTAWEVHFPRGALGVARLPGPLISEEMSRQRLSMQLENVDGLMIPRQLHAHLEVSQPARELASNQCACSTLFLFASACSTKRAAPFLRHVLQPLFCCFLM